MSNTSALGAVRSRWWVIALLTAAGAALGAVPPPAQVQEQSLTTTYTATHTMLLNDPENGYSTSASISPNQITLFATNGEVPERVAEVIGFEGSWAELAAEIQVFFDLETDALTFTTTQSTADRAVLIADTFAAETSAYITDRQDDLNQDRLAATSQRISELTASADEITAALVANPDDVALAGKASAIEAQLSTALLTQAQLTEDASLLLFTTLASAEPIAIEQAAGLSTPRSRTVRGALGGIVGLALGIAIAVMLSRLDRRLRTREQAEEVTGLRARVIIPKAKDDKHAQSLVSSGRHDALSDAYRTLRSVVGFVQGSLPPADRARVTLIVSPGPGEGKTTLASNLAATFAETGLHTIAVNTDFRHPQLSVRLTDNPWEPTAYILDDLSWVEPEQLLRTTKVANLSMLDLGGLGSPDELARVTASLLPSLASTCGAIVVDSSPVTATAEVLELVPLADVIVVVVRLNRTEMEAARRTIAILKDLTTAPLLMVISGMKQERTEYYYYGESSERRQTSIASPARKTASTAVATPGRSAATAPATAASNAPQRGPGPSTLGPTAAGSIAPEPKVAGASLFAKDLPGRTGPAQHAGTNGTNGHARMLDLDEIDEFLRSQPPTPR